ncbi:MAG: flagellar motor protein MotB, partial [Cellulosimicrobium funkei]
MARRRRGGHGGGGGGGGHDTGGSGRWMVSYMDMVTVLMCLFIVLFAISS